MAEVREMIAPVSFGEIFPRPRPIRGADNSERISRGFAIANVSKIRIEKSSLEIIKGLTASNTVA